MAQQQYMDLVKFILVNLFLFSLAMLYVRILGKTDGKIRTYHIIVTHLCFFRMLYFYSICFGWYVLPLAYHEPVYIHILIFLKTECVQSLMFLMLERGVVCFRTLQYFELMKKNNCVTGLLSIKLFSLSSTIMLYYYENRISDILFLFNLLFALQFFLLSIVMHVKVKRWNKDVRNTPLIFGVKREQLDMINRVEPSLSVFVWMSYWESAWFLKRGIPAFRTDKTEYMMDAEELYYSIATMFPTATYMMVMNSEFRELTKKFLRRRNFVVPQKERSIAPAPTSQQMSNSISNSFTLHHSQQPNYASFTANHIAKSSGRGIERKLGKYDEELISNSKTIEFSNVIFETSLKEDNERGIEKDSPPIEKPVDDLTPSQISW